MPRGLLLMAALGAGAVAFLLVLAPRAGAPEAPPAERRGPEGERGPALDHAQAPGLLAARTPPAAPRSPESEGEGAPAEETLVLAVLDLYDGEALPGVEVLVGGAGASRCAVSGPDGLVALPRRGPLVLPGGYGRSIAGSVEEAVELGALWVVRWVTLEIAWRGAGGAHAPPPETFYGRWAFARPRGAYEACASALDALGWHWDFA